MLPRCQFEVVSENVPGGFGRCLVRRMTGHVCVASFTIDKESFSGSDRHLASPVYCTCPTNPAGGFGCDRGSRSGATAKSGAPGRDCDRSYHKAARLPRRAAGGAILGCDRLQKYGLERRNPL